MDNYVGVNDVLDKRYRLDVLIGSGGFGAVYKGVDLQQNSTVAVKVLHAHLVTSSSMVKRFQVEGISGFRVKHPNAVKVLATGTTASGVPYLVMEYLEGVTLDVELRLHGILPFSRIVPILNQVCDVLIETHAQGIIHRVMSV